MINKVLKLAFVILFLFKSFASFGQEDINNESFTYMLKLNATGATIIYNGKSHSFTLDIAGKGIKETNVQNKAANQNFISFDKTFVQTSWVPMPQPIPSGLHLGSLTIDKQKEILDGYVNY